MQQHVVDVASAWSSQLCYSVCMKIFLVGGGTGGHFYPLIAVAEALRAQVPAEELKLAYIGPDAFEQAELDRVGIRYVWCPAGKVRRYVSILNVTDLFKTLFGLFVAFFKLLAAYPDVILSKGGYTAVPIILAARILRIPVVIHESEDRKSTRLNSSHSQI